MSLISPTELALIQSENQFLKDLIKDLQADKRFLQSIIQLTNHK